MLLAGHAHEVLHAASGASSQTVSTCAVCGNMSNARTDDDSIARHARQVARERRGIAAHVDHGARRGRRGLQHVGDALVNARARWVDEHDVGRQRVGDDVLDAAGDGARSRAASCAAQAAAASRSDSIATTRAPSRASGIAVAPEPAYASTTVRGRWARARSSTYACSSGATSAFTCANDATRRRVPRSATRLRARFVGFHQSDVADGTACEELGARGQALPPSITTDAPWSTSCTDARSSSAGGK